MLSRASSPTVRGPISLFLLLLLDDGSQVADLDLTLCLDLVGLIKSAGEEHANDGDMVGEETPRQLYRENEKPIGPGREGVEANRNEKGKNYWTQDVITPRTD
jgi:hypothetical protein